MSRLAFIGTLLLGLTLSSAVMAACSDTNKKHIDANVSWCMATADDSFYWDIQKEGKGDMQNAKQNKNGAKFLGGYFKCQAHQVRCYGKDKAINAVKAAGAAQPNIKVKLLVGLLKGALKEFSCKGKDGGPISSVVEDPSCLAYLYQKAK